MNLDGSEAASEGELTRDSRVETGRAEDRGPGPPAPRGPAEEKPGKGDAGEPPGAGRRNEEGGGPGISRGGGQTVGLNAAARPRRTRTEKSPLALAE